MFRLVTAYKPNARSKVECTVTLCENGKKTNHQINVLMKEYYPELFNVELSTFFTPVEYDLWQRKLDSIPKVTWKQFNDTVVMTIKNRRIYDKGTQKRKDVLERLFKV